MACVEDVRLPPAFVIQKNAFLTAVLGNDDAEEVLDHANRKPHKGTVQRQLPAPPSAGIAEVADPAGTRPPVNTFLSVCV